MHSLLLKTRIDRRCMCRVLSIKRTNTRVRLLKARMNSGWHCSTSQKTLSSRTRKQQLLTGVNSPSKFLEKFWKATRTINMVERMDRQILRLWPVHCTSRPRAHTEPSSTATKISMRKNKNCNGSACPAYQTRRSGIFSYRISRRSKLTILCWPTKVFHQIIARSL